MHVFLAFVACGGSTQNSVVAAPSTPTRTCLVLSVGGEKGIAHLGAIAAVKELGIPVQCVVGNSMGALAGSLFATAPTADTTQRYRELMARYIASTKSEAEDNAAVGGLLGIGIVLLSGGTALPALAAGAGGAMLGADSVDKVNLERFQKVLDNYYGQANIEGLPMPFATMHQTIRSEGGGMVDVRTGDVAQAVGSSIANPLIFPKLDPKAVGVLDPGVDRVAATPVDDACRMFPRSRLIVVNVSGKPVFVSNRMDCPVVEIDVPPVRADPMRVLTAQQPEFGLVVGSGYQAAMNVLSQLTARPTLQVDAKRLLRASLPAS